METNETKNTNKKWFWIAGVIILVAIIVLVVVLLLSKKQDDSNNSSAVSPKATESEDLVIKSLPIELAPYDPVTKTVGDIAFTNIKLENDMLYYDYGYSISASSAAPARKNPQPTFIVPLGTKVRAIVDGMVVSMPILYSNDYSVQIASSKNSQTIFEMEHVINPTVKVGDQVKAGDIIAEVSDYDTRNMPGFGLVEMGILQAGNPPKHVCPFLHMDPALKQEVQTNLQGLYAAWNEYKGKTIYDVSTFAMPGCVTTDEVEG